MSWSCLNTKYSLHQVQHHPKIKSLPLPACFPLRKYYSNLAWSFPASASPNSLNHGLPVHLWVHSIAVSNCISKLARSQPQSASPNSLYHSLQVHLWVHSISASKCICNLSRSRPQSAPLSSLNLSLQVHLSTHSITASKYIVNQRRRVYGDTGVMEVDCAMGEYIFGTPRGREKSSHFHLMWIPAIAWILMAG